VVVQGRQLFVQASHGQFQGSASREYPENFLGNFRRHIAET
jgi:hypothetical protein